MKLGTTYICVSDIQKSLAFYKILLQKEPLYANEDRWITFDCGNTLSLYNKHYDEKIMGKEENKNFNQAYIDNFYKDNEQPKNNIVIFNFEVDDLKQEYERLQRLNIGKVSDIMYVNIHMPYWYFNIEDPDGNIIEITGMY
jgi:lactoylglutathione lyase